MFLSKRLWISILLLIIFVGNFTSIAYAEDTTMIDQDAKGSITLYKYASVNGAYKDGTYTETDLTGISNKPIKGVGFKFLKIGDLVQATDSEGNYEGLYYTLDSDFLALFASNDIDVNPKMINGINYYTVDEINIAMEELNTSSLAYDNSDKGSSIPGIQMIDFVNENGTAMPDTDANGKTQVTGLDLGLYIVAEVKTPSFVDDGTTQTPAKASAPFLMPIPTTNITSIDHNAPGTMWQYDVVAYPKSELMSIRKDIVATGNDKQDGASANSLVQQTDKNIGDSVKFLLTSDVPVLQPLTNGVRNTNRKYIIEDMMSDGLTIDDLSANNFSVSLGAASYNSETGLTVLTYNTDYTVEAISNTEKGQTGFKLVLTEEGLKKLDLITVDSKLYVTYSARVNARAANNDTTTGLKQEENTYSLTYATSASEDMHFESNKNIKTYTYEINILKTFSAKVEDLTVVKFDIYNHFKDEDVKFIKESDGVYHAYDGRETGTPVTEVYVNASGNLTLKGLDDGVYSITELATVPGFNLLRDPVELTINAKSPENGTITSATVKNGEKDVAIGEGFDRGCVNFTIVNNETISALHTGDEGWSEMVFVLGILMLTCGLTIVIKKSSCTHK